MLVVTVQLYVLMLELLFWLKIAMINNSTLEESSK